MAKTTKYNSVQSPILRTVVCRCALSVILQSTHGSPVSSSRAITRNSTSIFGQTALDSAVLCTTGQPIDACVCEATLGAKQELADIQKQLSSDRVLPWNLATEDLINYTEHIKKVVLDPLTVHMTESTFLEGIMSNKDDDIKLVDPQSTLNWVLNNNGGAEGQAADGLLELLYAFIG